MNSKRGGMTPAEAKVIDHLVEAWNGFVKLPQQHPQDHIEFNQAIHRCQHLIMVRQVRDHYPGTFTNETKGTQ